MKRTHTPAAHPFSPYCSFLHSTDQKHTTPYMRCTSCFDFAQERSALSFNCLGAFGKGEKYDQFNDKHLLDLIFKGYTVIDDVLPPDAVTEAINFHLSWLEDLGTGISRDRLIETCTLKTLPSFVSTNNGIVCYPPPFFTPANIYVRSYPNVRKVFSKLWNTPDRDLIMSYDRIKFSVPSTKMDSDDCRCYHLNQGSERLGLLCYQGLINLVSTSEKGGGLACIPGSHLYHMEILDYMKEEFKCKINENSIKPSPGKDQKALLTKLKESYGLEPHIVRPVKAGAMVLWDSRLLHTHVPPELGSNEVRVAVNVCMVPRTEASTLNLRKLKQAAIQCRGTNHWPQYPNIFPNNIPFRIRSTLPKFNTKWTNEVDIQKTALKYFEDYAEQRGDMAIVVRHLGFEGVAEFRTCTGQWNLAKGLIKDEEDDKVEPPIGCLADLITSPRIIPLLTCRNCKRNIIPKEGFVCAGCGSGPNNLYWSINPTEEDFIMGRAVDPMVGCFGLHKNDHAFTYGCKQCQKFSRMAIIDGKVRGTSVFNPSS